MALLAAAVTLLSAAPSTPPSAMNAASFPSAIAAFIGWAAPWSRKQASD